MYRNLLLTAFRSLKKNRFFSILNIAGLAVGLAVFLFIAQYVKFETSYEDFLTGDLTTIYRVGLRNYINNELISNSAENYPGAGPALKSDLPEVTAFARLYNLGYKNNVIITNEEGKPDPIAFKHRKFLYADSSFLPMMGYPMVAGDATSALAEPLTAVISEKYARLYFGKNDPIGKLLRMQDDDYNNELVKVTGVFKNLPGNTHIKFDILISYKTLFTRFPDRENFAIARYDQSWQRKDMYTFIKVQPSTDVQQLESKFPALLLKNKPSLRDGTLKDEFFLQPLKDIHLTSSLAEEPESNGDKRIVFFLSAIGLFVLFIAWINYVNLSTAKAMERAKEVGIRKVMGAFKKQLIAQFLLESAIINAASLLIALVILFVALPYFNSISGLTITTAHLIQSWFLALLIALWILGTVLSGTYPAIVLSSFKPVSVLKGKLKNSVSGILLRKSLVVFQFMASVAIIAGTLIIYKQLNYMMSRDLGMNIDQVLVVERPGIAPRDQRAFNSAIDVFRNEVKKKPDIIRVSASATIPGKLREYKGQIQKYGSPDSERITIRFNSMDYDFINVFEMKLVAGRSFSPDYINDADTSVIITESASRLLGFKNPEEALGQTLDIPQFNPIVVGVVNDYHQVSLKKALEPTLFYCSVYGGEFYSLRIKSNNINESVNHIRQSWEKAFPGNPFDYFFLDDYFNQQYENERKFGKLFTVFAILAICVGCLGLFGLSAYTAMQRTKEIGVRKVLGSTEQGIFILLSKEYLKLIGIAITLASPLVWYLMTDWMQSFSYRTNISISVFIISGLGVLTVAIFTVSFQTLRAARMNPVDSLRQE